jgi:hypothetical protein
MRPRGYSNVQYPAKRQGKSVDSSAKHFENRYAEWLTIIVQSVLTMVVSLIVIPTKVGE